MHFKKNIILIFFTIVLLSMRQWAHIYALNHLWEVERIYSTGMYPMISIVLTTAANLFPFSIGEVIVVIVGFVGINIVVSVIVFLIKKKFKTLLNLVILIGFNFALILCFLDLSWLLNNYRPDFEVLAGMPVVETSQQALEDTFSALVLKTNALRKELSVDENSIPNDLTVQEVLSTAYIGFGPLSQQYSFFHQNRVLVKGLASSSLQTMSGYTGVYLFFIGEPTVNVEAPPYTIPHAACHEIAHQQGFAQEEAANYIGFLGCKNNPALFFQYSGYLAAVSYVGSALYSADINRYNDLQALYEVDVLNDLRYDQRFWQSHQKETPSVVIDQLNDTYLKSYNQVEGIKSYGKFVDLLIADFLQDGKI